VLGASVAVGVTAAGASTSLASKLAAEYPGYHVPATAPASLYRDTNDTSTPIKHVVVIFDENVSFDHYFGTYPYATNNDGTPFTAKPGTPDVNGLYSKITKTGPVGPLLTSNPNEFDPQRLGPSEALTCDQDHGYTPEQDAADNGAMDKFVQDTESDECDNTGEYYGPPGIVMDYYDGNTVTGLWNYAQNYAMGDNNFDTVFGPSTEGAVAVSSGLSTHASAVTPSGTKTADTGAITSGGTIYGDIDPHFDQCSDASHTDSNPEGVMTGQNIGNLLNAKHVTWGWFQGGFTPTSHNAGGAVCGAQSENIDGSELNEYTPHWEPFQFNASTANPAHLAPTSESEIGLTDQASHQYDISDFFETLKDGNLPSVSFLKGTTEQSGHPGESGPTDEQRWLVSTINQIEESKDWSSTAIVVTYDDSDGWYDHVTPKIVNGSDSAAIDTSLCEKAKIVLGTSNGRCGFGQRLPMLVISPYTRENYVSGNLTDTTSVVRFIEDNWLGGERIPGSYDAISGSLSAKNGLLDFSIKPHDAEVILSPQTGAVVKGDAFWGNDGLKRAPVHR
jgi:phospholipase C